MPRQSTGTYEQTRDGHRVRWTEPDGSRPVQGGFPTKTAARNWYTENVLPRLRRQGPSAEVTFDAFADLYFERWGDGARTEQSVREWLAPARKKFGTYTLRELEGAVDEIAAWRSNKTWSPDQRYKRTRALRQVLKAAQGWRYISQNPAVAAGPNPQPRGEEVDPFDADELGRAEKQLAGGDPRDLAIVTFAVETGLRTNEWIAAHRADVDRRGTPTIAVTRGLKRESHRRVVPLTPRAVAALDELPPRIDSPALFVASRGGYVDLNNWRNRNWTPALEAAGVRVRGPYTLRHTFATNALAAGMAPFMLCKLMGTSLEMIDLHYGHLTKDWTEVALDLLSGVGSAAQG